MKTTGIKTSPVNQGQKSSKKEQARQAMQDAGNKMPMKDKLVGGSGGFGLLGGGGGLIGKIASRFLGKASKTVKSFQNAPKQYNKLAKGKQKESIGGFREFANPKLRDHFNKVPKSKPVDFKGPNPAHNTGAGGNSYPR